MSERSFCRAGRFSEPPEKPPSLYWVGRHRQPSWAWRCRVVRWPFFSDLICRGTQRLTPPPRDQDRAVLTGEGKLDSLFLPREESIPCQIRLDALQSLSPRSRQQYQCLLRKRHHRPRPPNCRPKSKV